MKRGFFDEVESKNVKGEGLYEFLQFTPMGDKCLDLYKYVYELDDEYALYLSREFGYNINVLVKFDEDLGKDVLVHTYNSLVVGGQVMYMDVRGITGNFVDILVDLNEGECSTCKIYEFTDIEKAREYLTKLTDVKYDELHKEIPFIINNLKESYIM